jgi:drug/metabolite transporter (DMT)-like permease
MPPRPTASDWGLLVALALIWGTSFLVIKIAVSDFGPLTIVAGRLGIAALILVVVARIAGVPLPQTASVWSRLVVLALVGNALPFFLITWGQERIDSGLAGILMAIMPLATLLLAHFYVPGEHLTLRRVGGFLIGFAGIIVLIGPSTLLAFGGEASDLLRQLAVLAGALCYAVNAVLARRLPAIPALTASAGVMLVASLAMIPLALAVDSPRAALSEAAATSAIAILWLGVMSTALATIISFLLINSAGPTFMSLINFQIPIIALLAGVIFLGEHIEWNALTALVLVLSGLRISQSR